MIRKNRVIKGLVVIILLITTITGISYAYFNYFQEDSRQANIITGEVYVRVPENTASITLNKLYPNNTIEARNRNDNYIDFTVKAKNTSLTKSLYYALNIIDGVDIANKTRISREYIKVDLSEKVNGEYSDVYENISLSDFAFNDIIPANTTSEITSEYRLRFWISDAIVVSDTETNATFTQNEFANLFASYTVSVNAHDGAPPICKRVTDAIKLHKEACTNASTTAYCQADGYTSNSNIVYGKVKPLGSTLAVGDAFDCDVNGNGNYNERFYYISNYYNTSTKTFDTSTAVLIYYSNTKETDGVVETSSSGGSYYSIANENWHGPTSIINNLPTTTGWSNINLKNTSRTILACDDGNCSNTSLTTNNGSNTLTNPFNYTNLATRLLTVQELKKSECYALSNKESQTVTGSLKACNFLFEGTKYANSSNLTNGLWLENPVSSSKNIFMTSSSSRYVNTVDANNTTYGIRPVIDIPYSRMEY